MSATNRVVYVKPALKKKRYRVQYKNLEYTRSGWVESDNFRFKWQAVLHIRIVSDSRYDYRVIDSHD